MPRTWTARDSEAILLPSCIGLAPRSATESGCPTTTTRFALHLSSSYREMFGRDLAKCWRIRIVRVVRIRADPSSRAASESIAQLELKLNYAAANLPESGDVLGALGLSQW